MVQRKAAVWCGGSRRRNRGSRTQHELRHSNKTEKQQKEERMGQKRKKMMLTKMKRKKRCCYCQLVP